MNPSLIEKIDQLRNELKAAGHDNGIYTDSELIPLLYGYYHFLYNEGIDDAWNCFVYDKNDGSNISFLYVDDESGVDTFTVLVLLKDSTFSQETIKKEIDKAYSYINQASRAEVNTREVVRRKLNEFLDNNGIVQKLSSDYPVNITLVSLASINDSRQRNALQNAVSDIKKNKAYFSFSILFEEDILNIVLDVSQPQEFVSSFTLNIDKENNSLYSSNNKAVIVNVSAKSINDLYNKNERGLFAQNLRFYVKKKDVDNDIKETIKNNSNEFWYLNNGITIICDNFEISKNTIRLEKFSIINGGQTTHLLGNNFISEDFYVVCKVIKNYYSSEKEKIDFVSRIAEASNKQKPIKEEDLIANRPEQRALKTQLLACGVFCSIKRGEKVDKKTYQFPWQRTKSLEIAQLLTAYMYQDPGAARNSPKKLLTDKDRYNRIFATKEGYSSEMIIDLLKMKACYKAWNKKYQKENKTDPSKSLLLQLANNSELFTIAVIGLISKLRYRDDLSAILKSKNDNESKFEAVTTFDINHGIFISCDYYELEKRLSVLFETIIYDYVKAGFDSQKAVQTNLGSSNYTKNTKNYINCIFNQVVRDLTRYKDGIIIDESKLNIFKELNPNEKEADKKLRKANESINS